MKTRENNYDLLRILACFSVILLHINAIYYQNSIGGYQNAIECVINIITRFSVPCFVMLSGAFILNNPKTADYKSFYKKSFYKIVLPFLICILSFFCIDIINGVEYKEIIINILLRGIYNLWYIYMMIGLYIIAPVLCAINQIFSRKYLKILSFILLIIAFLSQYTTSYQMSYSLGVIFSYVPYFELGCIYYNEAKENKNIKAIYFILIIMLTIITFCCRYFFRISYWNTSPYSSFFSPTIIIYSLLIFKIFASANINKDLNRLSRLTFYIYLFHTIIYRNLVFNIFYNEILNILFWSVIVFIISLIVSYIFDCILKLVYKKVHW